MSWKLRKNWFWFEPKTLFYSLQIPKVVVCSPWFAWSQPRHGTICFVQKIMKGLVCLKGHTHRLLTKKSVASGGLFISYSKLWECLCKMILKCPMITGWQRQYCSRVFFYAGTMKTAASWNNQLRKWRRTCYSLWKRKETRSPLFNSFPITDLNW